jgi:hypothetical protein
MPNIGEQKPAVENGAIESLELEDKFLDNISYETLEHAPATSQGTYLGGEQDGVMISKTIRRVDITLCTWVIAWVIQVTIMPLQARLRRIQHCMALPRYPGKPIRRRQGPHG